MDTSNEYRYMCMQIKNDMNLELSFLPYSQDYIQLKLIEKYKELNWSNWRLLSEFYFRFVTFRKKNYCKHYYSECSFEQMWLMYYMDKVHGKYWDGDDWIDVLDKAIALFKEKSKPY